MITVAHLAKVYMHMNVPNYSRKNHKALSGTSYVKNSMLCDESHDIYCNCYVNQ